MYPLTVRCPLSIVQCLAMSFCVESVFVFQREATNSGLQLRISRTRAIPRGTLSIPAVFEGDLYSFCVCLNEQKCDEYKADQHKDNKQKWWNNQKASEMSQQFLPSVLQSTDRVSYLFLLSVLCSVSFRFSLSFFRVPSVRCFGRMIDCEMYQNVLRIWYKTDGSIFGKADALQCPTWICPLCHLRGITVNPIYIHSVQHILFLSLFLSVFVSEEGVFGTNQFKMWFDINSFVMNCSLAPHFMSHHVITWCDHVMWLYLLNSCWMQLSPRCSVHSDQGVMRCFYEPHSNTQRPDCARNWCRTLLIMNCVNMTPNRGKRRIYGSDSSKFRLCPFLYGLTFHYDFNPLLLTECPLT